MASLLIASPDGLVMASLVIASPDGLSDSVGKAEKEAEVRAAQEARAVQVRGIRRNGTQSDAIKLTVSQRSLEGLHLEERVQDEFEFSNALVAANVDGDSERDMA